MNVPFCDLGRLYQEQQAEISAAIQSVTESGWYILGKQGEGLERRLAQSLGIVEPGGVVGCNSGTDAIVLALLALGIVPGDEVITSALTAAPTACAIRQIGAVPVFADIHPTAWVVDPQTVGRVLTQRTRAVIPVHIYGNMADIDGLTAMLAQCGRSDVFIVEDVAQAQGSRLHGRAAGSLGAAGAFSFYPTKNLGALGDGGAVTARGGDVVERLRMLRFYGQKNRYSAQLPGGINSRLDEIQAAVLACRLPRLDEWRRRKARQIERYRSALAGMPLELQEPTSGCDPAWHLCVVALRDPDLRDPLVEHLSAQGVQTMVHYPSPVHKQPAFVQPNREPLPVAESLTMRILSLPMNPCLRDDEQKFIIDAMRSFPGWPTPESQRGTSS